MHSSGYHFWNIDCPVCGCVVNGNDCRLDFRNKLKVHDGCWSKYMELNEVECRLG